MDGHEVLAALMADEALRHLPVVILSVSSRNEDILQSYDLGYSSYVIKPPDFENLDHMVQAIADYWLGRVALP